MDANIYYLELIFTLVNVLQQQKLMKKDILIEILFLRKKGNVQAFIDELKNKKIKKLEKKLIKEKEMREKLEKEMREMRKIIKRQKTKNLINNEITNNFEIKIIKN